MSASLNNNINGIVHEKTLQSLSGKIGGEWRFLAKELGLSNAEIYTISQDYRDHQREIVFQILIRWKQRLGNEATVDKLAKALRHEDVERSDLGDNLEGNESSTQGVCDSTTT